MQLFGPAGVRRRIERIVARCGTLRVRVIERTDVEEQAVLTELTIGGRRIA
jgi:hypothetical protein